MSKRSHVDAKLMQRLTQVALGEAQLTPRDATRVKLEIERLADEVRKLTKALDDETRSFR